MANVTVIPARRRRVQAGAVQEKPKIKVAAYCRVSTDSDEQATSYEMQVEHYTDYITKNPKWLEYAKNLGAFLAGIQCDEGNPKVDGAWRGSYNLKTKKYAGRCDQNNPIDEGGQYSVYVGWCALPTLMGMLGVERILGDE